MPWVRIDDQFPQHPKVVGVGPLGIAMQVAGLCYCSHYLTDGFIPTSAIATFMDFSELDEQAFNGRGGVCWLAVQKLLDAGIWEETEGGYQIHDYLEYQPSKEKVLREREATKIRQGRFRGNVVSNASVTPLRDRHNTVSNSVPVPIPVPIPKVTTTVVTLNGEETVASLPHTQDGETQPEWFLLLQGMPQMKTTYATASAWKEANGISDELALTKVYSIRDWWPRQSATRQKGDVYSTWQNWCQRDKKLLGGSNGTTRPSIPSMEELEARSREKWGDPATRKQTN